MLRTLEPEIRVENKNAEADFKNPCSYEMKSVYYEITTAKHTKEPKQTNRKTRMNVAR